MKPEKQRIAIAEACGWKNVHCFNKHQEGGPASIRDGDLVGDFKSLTRSHLPNYLSNLNAVHEAEKMLDDMTPILIPGVAISDPEEVYADHLMGICCNPFRATAAQRCEALLKTLNLWEDEN